MSVLFMMYCGSLVFISQTAHDSTSDKEHNTSSCSQKTPKWNDAKKTRAYSDSGWCLFSRDTASPTIYHHMVNNRNSWHSNVHNVNCGSLYLVDITSNVSPRERLRICKESCGIAPQSAFKILQLINWFSKPIRFLLCLKNIRMVMYIVRVVTS
jgi:hypothetical protein